MNSQFPILFFLPFLISIGLYPLATEARFFFPESTETQISSSGNVSWTPLMKNESFLEEIKELEDGDPATFLKKSEGLWEKFSYATEESMNICYQFQIYRKGALFKACEEDMKKFEDFFFNQLYKARLSYLEWLQENAKKEFKISAQKYLND